ncbi:hypothetical protein ACTS9K_08580 [Empedobacter sp. ULE_I145]
MKLDSFTNEQLNVAWQVLDALQNTQNLNIEEPTEKVFMRFELIEDLKNKIDVRPVEEKIQKCENPTLQQSISDDVFRQFKKEFYYDAFFTPEKL